MFCNIAFSKTKNTIKERRFSNLNINLPSVADKVGNALTGLKLSSKCFLPFLCKCVTLASFKELVNIDDLNIALILSCK